MESPLHAVLSILLHALHWLLDVAQSFFADPNRVEKNNPFLHGNFGPVERCVTARSLAVTRGNMPADLRGEFVRNGPNPVHVPKAGYHWFDGDGMLHGVRLAARHYDSHAVDQTEITYINRYVETARYRKHDVFTPRIGELWGPLGLAKVLFARVAKLLLYHGRPIDQVPRGTANTSLYYHSGRMLALVESDPPTWVKILADGELETRGLYTYQGKLNQSFTAHPKTDSTTGEMMTFGYQIFDRPYVNYSVISKSGDLLRNVPIHIPDPVMMHDMAITENYTLFLDLPLIFKKENLLSRGKFPFFFDNKRHGRIGVLPRHATTDGAIRWFEIASCFIFHVVNAWEVQPHKEIVFYAIRYAELDMDSADGGVTARLCEWRLDLVGGGVSERLIAPDLAVEFPRVHPDKGGVPTQFAYAATVCDQDLSLTDGIAKFDLFSGEVVKVMRYPKGFGGEAVFVPKKQAVDEDDGYLMTFIYCPETDSSEFWVIDAKTLSHEPLAVVALPVRVPYGFHGIWVSEEEIINQR